MYLDLNSRQAAKRDAKDSTSTLPQLGAHTPLARNPMRPKAATVFGGFLADILQCSFEEL